MALTPLPFYLINAFTTDTPHSGNQAGVVIFPADDPRSKDEAYQLNVAKDIYYSETAFLVPVSPGRWTLRWWTPEAEVKLCGHATLAAARVLFSLHPELDEIKFDTRWSGELRAEKIQEQGNSTLVKIFLPTWSADVIDQLTGAKAQKTDEYRSTVAGILGVDVDDVLEVAPFHAGFVGDVIQLRPSVDLAALKPDAKAFVPFSPQMTIVTQVDETASGPGKLAIKSRVHCEDFGIGEDPVTGSAHAYLAAYWLYTDAKETVKKLVGEVKPEQVTIEARQLSERGGKLEVRLVGERQVSIVGSASEMAKGTLSVW